MFAARHGVIALENHVRDGGIGSPVAEIMADADCVWLMARQQGEGDRSIVNW